MTLNGCRPVLWLRAGRLCWILEAMVCNKGRIRRVSETVQNFDLCKSSVADVREKSIEETTCAGHEISGPIPKHSRHSSPPNAWSLRWIGKSASVLNTRLPLNYP